MSNPIRKLRTERAWSQEQLAEMAGLSVRTVQRAENGAPSGLETLKSLAAVFEVSLDTLRGEAQEIDPTEDNTMNEQTLDAIENKQPSSLEITIRRSGTLAVILAMLTLINYLTLPQYMWVKWPALGIGLAILGLWAAWLSGTENYEAEQPKTLKDMLNTSGIMLVSLGGLVLLNLLLSPQVLWVKWPAAAMVVALPLMWINWYFKK